MKTLDNILEPQALADIVDGKEKLSFISLSVMGRKCRAGLHTDPKYEIR